MFNYKNKFKKRMLVGMMAIGMLIPNGTYAKDYGPFSFNLTSYYQKNPVSRYKYDDGTGSSTGAGAFAMNTQNTGSRRAVIRLTNLDGSTNYSNGYTHSANSRKAYANWGKAGYRYTFTCRNHVDDSGGIFKGQWSPDNY